MKTLLHAWQYLAKFFLEWEMLQILVIEKVKIHILRLTNVFQKPCPFFDNVEKYDAAIETKNGSMAARCVLD